MSQQTQIQLKPLAKWAGIRYIQASVTDIDVTNNTIHTNDPDFPTVSYTVTSLDIGSRTRDAITTPGVSDFAIPTRPISLLVKRIAAAEESMQAANSVPQSVVIVGGGAAGIELSLAMRARWSKAFPSAKTGCKASRPRPAKKRVRSSKTLSKKPPQPKA